MIRVIVRTQDATKAVNAGGVTETEYRTFELNAPELEAYLREPKDKKWIYSDREVVGVELTSGDEVR